MLPAVAPGRATRVGTVPSVSDPRATPRARCGFLHIPKTAGTSVHRALVHAYGPSAISRFRFDDACFGGFTEWDTLAPAVRTTVFHRGGPITADDRSSRVVSGHLSYRSITSLVDPDDVCTVLREPRARLLSHHLFWGALTDHETADLGSYRAHRSAVGGLQRFLSDPLVLHQTDNLQVRMLAGVDLDPTRPLTTAERHDLVESARRNLGTLGCTTFVEAPTFWHDVSSFIGADIPEWHENVADLAAGSLPFHGAQLDTEARELLAERTAADRVIYLEVVADALGLDADAAGAFADGVFAEQAERYERLVETPARPPVTPVRPPVGPAARARARLVGLARRGRRLLG